MESLDTRSEYAVPSARKRSDDPLRHEGPCWRATRLARRLIPVSGGWPTGSARGAVRLGHRHIQRSVASVRIDEQDPPPRRLPRGCKDAGGAMMVPVGRLTLWRSFQDRS